MTPLTVDPIGVDLLHEQIARNTLARANLFYALEHPQTFDPERLRQALHRLDEPTAEQVAQSTRSSRSAG